MKKLFNLLGVGSLMFLGVACASCDKENGGTDTSNLPMEQVSYDESSEIIVNPERGFYKASSCEMGVSGALNVSTLEGYREDGYSLVFRYFYLKTFRDKPLTDEALQFFDKDMAAMREAGVKCVLRFAYTSAENEPDAPLSIIETHIDQLKPYIAKNADVIAVWQAGFIGSWGEWYYTTNNLYNPTARKAVLDKLLEALPEGRVVQVRTPQYKQEYLNRTTPIQAAEAYTSSNAARIGHHNDCFMASIETLYDLRHAIDYVVASPCEIMAAGFPYDRILPHLFDDEELRPQLGEICREFWNFYQNDWNTISGNEQSGCISLTVMSELEALASEMRRVVEAPKTDFELSELQYYKGGTTKLFYDLGHYVQLSCGDQGTIDTFEAQLERAVPSEYRFHTPSYYSAYNNLLNPITCYTGITTSEPETTEPYASDFRHTSWYLATH